MWAFLPAAAGLTAVLVQLIPAVPAPETDRAAAVRSGDLFGDPSAASPLPLPVSLPLDSSSLAPLPAATTGQYLPAVGSDLSGRIPSAVLAAYRRAAELSASDSPGCHLPWSLLAGIGLIESGHARSGGSHQPGWEGTASPPILGPALSGGPFAAIRDTDGGRFDGDRTWDRAVGPMQFLPSTWSRYGVDASGDGRSDPQTITDASAAAARYLCAAGRDLRTPAGLFTAVFSYNHSNDYVRAVLTAASRYGETLGAEQALQRLPASQAAPVPGPSGTAPGPARSPNRRPAPPSSAAPRTSSTPSSSAAPSTSASPAASGPAPSPQPTTSTDPELPSCTC